VVAVVVVFAAQLNVMGLVPIVLQAACADPE
jgi:hypothetical protein